MNREYYPITIIMVTCLLLDGLFACLHQPVPSVVDHVLLVTLGILVPSDVLVPRPQAAPAAAPDGAAETELGLAAATARMRDLRNEVMSRQPTPATPSDPPGGAS